MRYLLLILVFFAVKFNLKAQTFTVVLGKPTQNSITANIVFSSDVDFYIEYGPDSTNLANTLNLTSAQAHIPKIIELSDLVVNRQHYYRIKFKLKTSVQYKESEMYHFHTQRAKGEGFTFTIEADEHLYDKKGYTPLYEICLANQALDRPDFMFSLGDTFGDDHTPDETTSADMKALHEDYLKYLGKITHSIPFFFCLGNHEGENGYYLQQNNGENIAVYGTQWRKYYYPNPYPNEFYSGNMTQEAYGIGYPENYYAFTWGDVLFLVLDVYRDCDVNEKPQKWDWTLGEVQYKWFRKTLEESTAKYKLVFAHHTRGQGRGGAATAKGYEWGGYNNTKYEFDSQRPGWGKPIQQVMNDTGVNIFFQGHDHLFAWEKVDGVVYQEVPMPSDSSYKIGVTDNGDAYTDVILDGSGHLRVNVSPQCLTIDYIRAYLPKDTLTGMHKNREVAYSYTIGQCANSIDEKSVDEDVLVYPNPTTNQLIVTIPGNTDAMSGELQMLDLNGKGVQTSIERIGSRDYQINTQMLSKGMYILKIGKSTSPCIYKKILIQ